MLWIVVLFIYNSVWTFVFLNELVHLYVTETFFSECSDCILLPFTFHHPGAPLEDDCCSTNLPSSCFDLSVEI